MNDHLRNELLTLLGEYMYDRDHCYDYFQKVDYNNRIKAIETLLKPL